MRTIRNRLRVAMVWAPLLFSVACDRNGSAPAPGNGDTVGGSSAPDSLSADELGSGWDATAGPFVVLPTVDGGLVAGSLLLPEATESTVDDTTGLGRAMGDGRLDLFARGGKVGEARLTVERAPKVEPGCTAWPVARLSTDPAQPLTGWTAAFAAGRVQVIPLDSIEGLASRDSARLAADLTRLASGLPDDTSATFRGLPFVVLRAWRSRGLDSGFVVAALARRVNQEDDPKEERLIMVVEAASPEANRWQVGWHERAAGHEEELVVAEPLLAFRVAGDANVRLLFGRDDGVALGAAVLTRVVGQWRVQWESAVAGCN